MEQVKKLLDFMYNGSEWFNAPIIKWYMISKEEILSYIENNRDLEMIIIIREIYWNRKYWYPQWIDKFIEDYNIINEFLKDKEHLKDYYKILDLDFYINEYKSLLNKLPQKREKKKVNWVIYFIREVWGKLIKIGKTKDIKNRYRKYVTENSKEIEIIKIIEYDDYTSWEIWRHELFDNYRVRWEWFKLPKHEIEFIKSFTIENLIKYEV